MQIINLGKLDNSESRKIDKDKSEILLRVKRNNAIVEYIAVLANINEEIDDQPEFPEILGEYLVIKTIPEGKILVLSGNCELLVITEDGSYKSATSTIETTKKDFLFEDFVEMGEKESYEYYKFAMWTIGVDV